MEDRGIEQGKVLMCGTGHCGSQVLPNDASAQLSTAAACSSPLSWDNTPQG
jgi:hypothetical protein